MDQTMLQNCFTLLWDRIAEEQKSDSNISFSEGLLFTREGYKYDVSKQGKEIMEAVPWDEKGIVGSEKIFLAACRALSIIPKGDTEIQNLVDWSNLGDFYASKKTKMIEKALKLLYVDDKEKEAFETLRAAVGNHYALISYFFFLKDSTRYAVMRPDNFRRRLVMIGESAKCTKSPTWDNYMTFCNILAEVRDFLQERVDGEMTLLEAHSFVWSFYMIEDVKITRECMADEVPENESHVVVSSKEGKKDCTMSQNMNETRN